MRAKASEDDRMHSTNARTGKQGSDGLPCHRHIDGNGITLFDAERFEYVGDGADFMEELGIADGTATFRFITFIDYSGLRKKMLEMFMLSYEMGEAYFVWMLERPPVDTVV